MQNDNDRPSTETAATPKPPAGENMKDLVTPGDDSKKEADADAIPSGADTIEGDVARPEDAEEAQSPT
ncbi:hypothetical protein [Chenggangzhangella methanolivorans]|uniref:Uncharacterized protein n=1 Tax=Chenggangzhangella methanolivorans TaxID=1437009 RepID=A0A9E6R7B9_9HYPH|nr:hypothetical protein [Chenggangzhangella methanolivorans]QZN99560.1 hypothetical protein K6K41_23090 [Chenggangzhangella methanolivorans]